MKYPPIFNVYLDVGDRIMFCFLSTNNSYLTANSYEQQYCVRHYLNQQRLYLSSS
ncbi:MAG: hypothetical protein ACRC06_18760 [Waterburya sp.]